MSRLILVCGLLAACGTAPQLAQEPTGTFAAPLSTPGDFQSGIYTPFNDVPLFSLNGAQGVANGNAAISFVSPSFAGTLDANDQLDTFNATINLRGALTLEVRVDAAGDFTGSVPLPMTALPPFTVGSVVVTPFVYSTLNFTGSAAATSRVSLVAPFEASVQFAQPGKLITTPTRPTLKPELGAPDAAAGAEVGLDLEVGVIFLVSIDGIPVGGPALSTTVGIDLHIAGLPAPAWSADLATELWGAWTFLDPVTSLPTIPNAGKRLAHESATIAGGAIPLGLSSSRWSRVYDLQESELSAGLVKSGDGAVLVGNTRLNSMPWMSAIDGTGLPLWQTTSVSQPFGAMNVKSLIEATNGDLVAVGWPGTGTGMRAERYGPTGTPLWARTFAGAASTLLSWNTTVATPSGGAILGGQITYVSTGVKRCALAELDSTGTMLWATEVDLGPGTSSPSLSGLALTSTGQLLAAGTVTYQDLPSPYDAALRYQNGFVLRLDAQGNAQSAFAVGGNLGDYVNALAVFPDDSYALGGYTGPGSGGAVNWAWITSFDAQDALRWSATYAGDTNGSYGHVSALATLPSNGLLVTGGYGTPTSTQEAWLFRVDSAGMPVWFKALRGPADDTLTQVVKMKGGGALALGYTKSVNDVTPLPQSDLWVVRTSVDGMVDFTAASGMDAANDSARWQRTEHVIRPLAPVNVATTLTANAAPFNVTPASATSELLTP